MGMLGNLQGVGLGFKSGWLGPKIPTLHPHYPASGCGPMDGQETLGELSASPSCGLSVTRGTLWELGNLQP